MGNLLIVGVLFLSGFAGANQIFTCDSYEVETFNTDLSENIGTQNTMVYLISKNGIKKFGFKMALDNKNILNDSPPLKLDKDKKGRSVYMAIDKFGYMFIFANRKNNIPAFTVTPPNGKKTLAFINCEEIS